MILATRVARGRQCWQRVTAGSVREAGIGMHACARMPACHRHKRCAVRLWSPARRALLPPLRERAAAMAANVSMVAPSAPRDARSKTPPGPEGSNGIDRRGRRGQPAGLPPFQLPRKALQARARVRPPFRGNAEDPHCARASRQTIHALASRPGSISVLHAFPGRSGETAGLTGIRGTAVARSGHGPGRRRGRQRHALAGLRHAMPACGQGRAIGRAGIVVQHHPRLQLSAVLALQVVHAGM